VKPLIPYKKFFFIGQFTSLDDIADAAVAAGEAELQNQIESQLKIKKTVYVL